MNDVSRSIGWADKSLNLITGCLNHVNGLCKGGGFPCYAYIIANRFKDRYLANQNIAPDYPVLPAGKIDLRNIDPFYPRFCEERFKPLKGYPEGTKIFLNDMSDWMGPWIPDEWKRQVIEFIKAHPQYIFQTLTKQPRELWVWSPFPENCWVGVTVTNADAFYPAFDGLYDIEAKVKFVSFEPLLENPQEFTEQWSEDLGASINWLIIGAQTKPYKPPKIEWVQEIVQAADKADIPVFLKDNLRPLVQQTQPSNLYSGTEWELGIGWGLIQEFPK